MTPLVTVRPADSADAEALDQLYQELVPNPDVRVLPERLAEIAEDRWNHLLVAELHGKVCGSAFVTLCMAAMFGRQPYAILENVIVAAAYRRNGIGSVLMREVELLCKRTN